MQSGVLLRCKLRRDFGGVASHNPALRIICVLQITAKRRVRTCSDPRTLAARKAAPCKARRDQRVKWRALRLPLRTQERRAGSGLHGDRRRGWCATIRKSAFATTMMAGGEESKAA